MRFCPLMFVIALLPSLVDAQSIEGDLLALNKNQPSLAPVQQKGKRSWNPLASGYQLGIKFYQRGISEQLAANCAFELTCSRFSGAMVKEYGFVKGYFLTFDRVSRCSRISSLETFPIRLNAQGKIIETPADFHFH